MGAYAFNDRVAQPWYAPAGFNRGGLENVIEARRRLTQSQRDDLYASRINPIATFTGGGIVVWGQKTLQKRESALDRVNVRRMLLTVRKTIAGFSRLFVFEANNPTSRNKLLAIINTYLATVRDNNGLVQFRAVLDETTTTPDLVDRNIMKGKIYLQPTYSAEIIQFDYILNNSGLLISE
jgi:phage tail sheath protein FI